MWSFFLNVSFERQSTNLLFLSMIKIRISLFQKNPGLSDQNLSSQRKKLITDGCIQIFVLYSEMYLKKEKKLLSAIFIQNINNKRTPYMQKVLYYHMLVYWCGFLLLYSSFPLIYILLANFIYSFTSYSARKVHFLVSFPARQLIPPWEFISFINCFYK